MCIQKNKGSESLVGYASSGDIHNQYHDNMDEEEERIRMLEERVTFLEAQNIHLRSKLLMAKELLQMTASATQLNYELSLQAESMQRMMDSPVHEIGARHDAFTTFANARDRARANSLRSCTIAQNYPLPATITACVLGICLFILIVFCSSFLSKMW